MTRLDEQHRARQHALRVSVGDRLGAMLSRLALEGDHVQAELEAYAAGAYLTVAGGQRASASTSAGYAELRARARRRTRRARALNVEGALERSGVLVTPASSSLVAPVLRAMSLSSSGSTLVDAVTAAASYAYALSSNDLQAASSVGLDEGASASGSRLVGFTRELAPGCCEWCASLDGEVFDTAGEVPFHDRDACSVAPVFE